MNINILLKKMSALLIITLLVLSFVQPVYAATADKKVVRVAYFNMGDYYKEVYDGNVNSYDTEVLNKIEKYSNLTFEYVNCGTWAEAFEMLDRNKVDLVGTVQWTYEREEQYEFCLESYGYTAGELAALNDSNFVYEDYNHIGKAVIGCTGNYVRMKELNQLFTDHNIAPKMRYYDNQLDLENALESGEVDLIAANSHTLKDNYSVIEKFMYSPFYFVSRKGNTQITDQIDNALIYINLRESHFDDSLMVKYFPSIIGAPLTKEEIDLISENNTYDVYFDAATKPTSWYDEKTGTMKGGLVEVCRQITKNTGLKLNPVPLFAEKTKMDDTMIRTTTVYAGANENLLSRPGETNAFLNENFNFYYRDIKKIDLNKDSFTVAIVANRVHLRDYISNTYPNAIVKEYDTPVTCLKSVENGECDLTYLNCRIADNAITENGIDHVKQFPVEPQQQGIALLFPEKNRELLVSIVNKGLEQVDQDVLSDLFVQYALDTHKPVTINSIIQDNLGLFLIVALALILIVILFAVLFTYARVMKRQKDKIAKSDADRTEFFGRMSHDMRTPMNGILGMIDLSENSDDIAEVHDNLHKARAAGKYMLSLINDTLDLQRMESKKLQLESNIVNVNDYYDELFSILKVSAEQKGLDFNVKYVDIEMDNYIVLDALRVKQILSNLISNAIKFTPKGGKVEIIVESLGQDEDILHRKFQVIDTGVGMSEDFIQNRLFKPYSQENNKLSSQLTGSGLGMAITKNLVELMDGHLEVKSALGEGTAYFVYLDFKQASKEDIEKEALKKELDEKSVALNLSGKRILLCEDHPLNAEISKRLLMKVGCNVDWADNGAKGLKMFEESDPGYYDAILMDIRMPIMDGLQATKMIRTSSHEDAKKIVIIAMSANAYEDDVKASLDAGMNAHLAKPVEPKKMYLTICNALYELNDNI